LAESPPTDLTSPAIAFPAYNKRLLISILLGNIALFELYSAFTGILLPSMIQAADPANKVANLAIVSGVSAIFATVFNPLGGAWSDRTRSRWGRRTPWLIGAAIATLLGSIFLGVQTTIAGILIGWCLVQGLGNIFQAAITAVIPDRVPPEKRGTASAVAGLGPMIGGLFGLAIAGAFIQTPWIAAAIVGLLLVAAALLFIFLAPEKSALAPFEQVKVNAYQTVRSFFSSLSHHNFRFVFTSRLLMMLGFFAVQGYFYYLLQDYIHIENYGLQSDQGVLIMTLVSTAGSLISILLGGVISDRTGRRKNLVIWSAIFIAFSMVVPRIYPTWPAMILFNGLLGLGFGLYLTVGTALVTLVLPKTDNFARDMGIFNMANTIPLILAPFISALLITSLGGYASLFVWGVLLSILAALAILPIRGVE
jgi:MFS family permease